MSANKNIQTADEKMKELEAFLRNETQTNMTNGSWSKLSRSLKLKKIIEKQKPDEIAIEDVPLVKSVSVAKLLARFNGVAMIEAYRHLQHDPVLYLPSEWKKIVVNDGAAKKCEIQLWVCKYYKLLTNKKIVAYIQRIEKTKSESTLSKEEIKLKRVKLKKTLRAAKKEKDETLIDYINISLKELTDNNKLERKKKKKDASKIFDAISMDIYAESGINEDIGDSIGTAIALKITRESGKCVKS